MGRYYYFSKKVSETESKNIVREMAELDDVDHVKITEDGLHLMVQTKDDKFADVMVKAVNICNQVAEGTKLSFEKFV